MGRFCIVIDYEPDKNKLKNAGRIISDTRVEVDSQAKDSELLEKNSNGMKEWVVYMSQGVKDGAEEILDGGKWDWIL